MPSRILIADNNARTRARLAGWLEGQGCICVTATRSDALSEARRDAPDAAIVAVDGPDHGGLWVVRALRQLAQPVAVIVICPHPDEEVASAANRLGAIDCLPGPVTAGVVGEAVRRAVLWREAVSASAGRRLLDAEVADGRTLFEETVTAVDPHTAVSVLLTAFGARTPDAVEHVHRVAVTAAVLAQSLGLAREAVEHVRRAALLHHIGAMLFTHAPLAGGDPIADADVSLLRHHALLGHDVLASIRALADSAPLVAAMHASFDGAGCAGDARGEQIPIGARILAVADLYDRVITAGRDGGPCSHDEARARLVGWSGNRLDPVVVTAWLGLTEVAQCS